MNKDWIFKDDGSIRAFRAAGVLLEDGKLLVQQDICTGEYALPGGHVALGEESSLTVEREFLEELGLPVRCGELMWVEENFWRWDEREAHTLCFYYRVETKDGRSFGEGTVVSRDNPNVRFRLLALEDIPGVIIYPSFLSAALLQERGTIRHFVSHE